MARGSRLPSLSTMVPCLKGSPCFTAPTRNGWGIKEDVTISTWLGEKLQEPFFGVTWDKKVMETARKHHRGERCGEKCSLPLQKGRRMSDEQTNPSWADPREPAPGAAPEGVNSPASALSGQQPNKLCPRKTNHNHH